MAFQTNSRDFERLYCNIFFPPKLPEQEEQDASELYLARVVRDVLREWRKVDKSHPESIDRAMHMIELIIKVHNQSGDFVDEAQLLQSLLALSEGHIIALNIQAQNAAVLITRQDEIYLFEVFELSARNLDVMTTAGRLIRTFPGRAVEVSRSRIQESNFSAELSRILAVMSHQAVPSMRPQTMKADTQHVEIRDTTRPCIVSELLFGVLRSVGHAALTIGIKKRTRDEVNWSQALKPWRRSPMWLMIRVALQLAIERSCDVSLGLYKQIMLYIMSHVLKRAVTLRLSAEVLFTMTSKITRRLTKLLKIDGTLDENDSAIGYAYEVLELVNHELSTRWKAVQTRDAQSMTLTDLLSLNPGGDCYVDLRKLNSHITQIHDRSTSSLAEEFKPVSRLVEFQSDRPPKLDEANFCDAVYSIPNLRAFEEWVDQHLKRWSCGKAGTTVCETVHDLIPQYHRHASRQYKGNPEALSVMLLVIFELWVACDSAATSTHPLMLDYDPAIWEDPLQSLLLPFGSQLKRLQNIEAYLHARKDKSKYTSRLMFCVNQKDGFPNRYYEESNDHQVLLKQIQAQAALDRAEKRDELAMLKEEYRKLDNLVSTTRHNKRTVLIDTWTNETEERHMSPCPACNYKTRRDALRIDIFEEPLPESLTEAKSVVFELNVPPTLSYWRDTRSFLLHSVLKGRLEKEQLSTRYKLSENDPHLTKRYFRAQGSRGIDLLSSVKPVVNSHYRDKLIPEAEIDSVCVKNGMRYRYFDVHADAYLTDYIFDTSVARDCTYQDVRECLRGYLERTAAVPDGKTPNQVIASQDTCPPDMTAEEFKALATVPFGLRIQWMNIASELSMPGVDFRKVDTIYVFLQCIYQTGPSHDTELRTAHAILAEHDFSALVVDRLQKAMQRIRQNWGLVHALGLFVAVAARVLSLSHTTILESMAFLEDARQVSADWTRSLRDKAHEEETNDGRTHFIRKSVESALVCLCTFVVDQGRLADLLVSSKNAALMVEMSIIVQDGQQTLPLDSALARLMMWRVKRLLHRSYKILSANHLGISVGIKRSWAGLPSTAMRWSKALSDTDEWVVGDDTTAGSIVHYNLLTGELLVNGDRLNQPPKDYCEHALFRTLFRNHVVEVMPTMEYGFKCSTKRSFFGFHVLLGMEGGELIVRASHGGIAWETVPKTVLHAEYPSHFSFDYVHWYNLNTGEVKLKNIRQPWPMDIDACWTLQRCRSAEKWFMQKGDLRLIGLKSDTAEVISRLVEPLADQSRVHIQLDAKSQDLHVDLHAAKLHFCAKRGCAQLRSKEYPTMSVSEDQSIGTLIGLRSKLLLRSDDGNFSVLIPESTVSVQRDKDHVLVDVAKTNIRKVHALEVDLLLGRLINKDSLGCKIYLSHLHALTSFCLPDPLTRRTGTEQALTILRSKSLTSFSHLTKDDISTLNEIARLSPGRQFYPQERQCMQTMSWNPQLSFLSQDDNFIRAVEHIFCIMRRHGSLFSPDSDKIVCDFDQNSHQQLQKRGRIRASFLRTPDFGAEDHTEAYDHIYDQRDNKWSPQASNSFSIASIFSQPGSGRHLETPTQGYLWDVFSSREIAKVHAAPDVQMSKMMRYDASFIKPDYFDLVLERFPAIHAWLTKSGNAGDCGMAVMMWLASLAYSKKADMHILQALVLFTKALPSFTEIDAPLDRIFRIPKGKACHRATLAGVENRFRLPFGECPEAQLQREPNEKKASYDQRRERIWEHARGKFTTKFLDGLIAQWPCADPSDTRMEQGFRYTRTSQAMIEMRQHFKTWHDNLIFFKYLAKIEAATAALSLKGVDQAEFHENTPSLNPSNIGYLLRDDLFAVDPPVLPEPPSRLGCAMFNPTQKTDECYQLGAVICALQSTYRESAYERGWISELQESWQSLQRGSAGTKPSVGAATKDFVISEEMWQSYVVRVYDILCRATESGQPPRFMACTSHRNRTNSTMFLQQLTRSRWAGLSSSWKKVLVSYGLALSNLRRARRLVRYLESEDDLINELKNEGHTWDPMEYPEWLILEIESDLTIRTGQYQIAAQMLQPDTAQNSVMQMNMGEGKSTVIIPMLAMSIADGAQLARVIVNRPQSKQMLHMLVAKFGGIINRQVYHLPFARSPRLTSDSAIIVKEVLEECVQTGGILLAQPEHLLSFLHMAPEHYFLHMPALGHTLRSIQTFLDDNCRDIIDECDETFSVRLELIYTIGNQRAIEAHSDRWGLIQEVFGIIRALAPDLHDIYPSAVELSASTPGSFRRLRVLTSDAMNVLIQRVAGHISSYGVSGLQVCRQTPDIRNAFVKYICEPDITKADAERFETTPFWTPQTQPLILLLRGLMAGGILNFVLGQKRWRVNFGLAERQPPTKLAVPYRAKDCPALRSEFSHPDVVIALSLLSYYYGGLSDPDLFIAFGHLVESDQADVEYQVWAADAFNLPEAVRQLQGVNLEDRPQCVDHLFPAFRAAKSTVDYFLANIVFPREMKEFPKKLSASGWDIAKKKQHLTTGFSGTKDSRPTLPLDINHLDLPEQRHTSALVLEHLLQETNSVTVMSRSTHEVSDAEAILDMVSSFERPVQVILDVGAQVLELDNLAMAKRWLEQDNQNKEAVVFVDHEDNICVVDRRGKLELLHASSFANSLATCLVFLDQSHTRGIDLKLPRDYRAAIMLGPRLEKDSLIQACMRMRKLGKGQSLEFCIPPDVQTTILETTQCSSCISVADIIHWSITETFTANRRNMPIWAVQGERFLRQKITWAQGLTQDNAYSLLENERHSIEDRYRPYPRGDGPDTASSQVDLASIWERCEQFGKIDTGLSTLQEEQERELAPEKEQERELQRPPPMQPAAHSLHQDVAEFARKGILRKSSSAYMPAFESLRDLSASQGYPIQQLCIHNQLWVTRDFASTVVQIRHQDFTSDFFLRSVRWLLTTSTSADEIDTIMIISPFEANQLVAGMKSSSVRMHVYGPRSNTGYESMDALDFYVFPTGETPRSLHLELAAMLNMFSGQLYFSSYLHYVAFGRAFGLSTEIPSDGGDRNCHEVDNDGFIRGVQSATNESGLTQSPVQFLKRLALIRNGGRSIERTHVGQCLAGAVLTQGTMED